MAWEIKFVVILASFLLSSLLVPVSAQAYRDFDYHGGPWSDPFAWCPPLCDPDWQDYPHGAGDRVHLLSTPCPLDIAVTINKIQDGVLYILSGNFS